MDDADQMPRLVVRRAQLADLAAVAAIHTASFSSAWTQDEWQRMLSPPSGVEADNTLFLVALSTAASGSSERLTGFLVARRLFDEAEIISVAVEPSCRRMGIAQRLIGHLIEQLSADLPCRVLLEVSIENWPALAFYRKNRFIELAIRKGYYAVPGRKPIDAQLLARALSNESCCA